MVTSRQSPRCAGSGQLSEERPRKIIDCPTCGRPVRLQVSAVGESRVPSHGTVQTRNTKAADDRMRMLREMGL